MELANTLANVNRYDDDGLDGQGWHQTDRLAKAVNYTAQCRKESIAEATQHVLVRLATTGETLESQIERMGRSLLAAGRIDLP